MWNKVDKECVTVIGNMAYEVVSLDHQNHGEGQEYEVVESQPQTSATAGSQEATYEVIAGN